MGEKETATPAGLASEASGVQSTDPMQTDDAAGERASNLNLSKTNREMAAGNAAQATTVDSSTSNTLERATTVKSGKSNSSDRWLDDDPTDDSTDDDDTPNRAATVKSSKSNSSERATTVKSSKSNSQD